MVLSVRVVDVAGAVRAEAAEAASAAMTAARVRHAAMTAERRAADVFLERSLMVPHCGAEKGTPNRQPQSEYFSGRDGLYRPFEGFFSSAGQP
jgi:hypothetical protein